jgi:arylsulfatase A-like enzyme
MRLLIVLLIFLSAVVKPNNTRAGDGRPRPNIVLLVTDDQRWDCLGCAHHPLLKTPHIDRLAKEGVLFRNTFATTAICCVSRASIITGRYARNHRVPDFNTPLAKNVLETTFFALLRRLGYMVACFGKWGIGGPMPESYFAAWDAWGGQGDYFHKVNGELVHNSEYLARKAIGFLEEQRPGKPFCLLVYYKAPHEPYLPDPRDAALFKDDPITGPKTFTKAHFAQLPDFLQQSLGAVWGKRDHPNAEKHAEFIRQYLRCIAGVDRSVGKIMGALDRLKLADNTLVLYSSDHGMFLGEHGLSGKWLMHEESIRVPLIVHYPKLPPAMRGKRLDAMALNIDLAPTIVDFAGGKVPAEMDGRSLKPLLTAEPVQWRDDFFYEHHYHHGGRIPRSEGVRTARWSYITYFDVQPKYEELYDLERDPLQEHNRLSRQTVLQAMRRLHLQYVSRLPPAALPTHNPPPAKK